MRYSHRGAGRGEIFPCAEAFALAFDTAVHFDECAGYNFS